VEALVDGAGERVDLRPKNYSGRPVAADYPTRHPRRRYPRRAAAAARRELGDDLFLCRRSVVLKGSATAKTQHVRSGRRDAGLRGREGRVHFKKRVAAARRVFQRTRVQI